MSQQITLNEGNVLATTDLYVRELHVEPKLWREYHAVMSGIFPVPTTMPDPDDE